MLVPKRRLAEVFEAVKEAVAQMKVGDPAVRLRLRNFVS